jgi:hypothetical protein
MAHYRDRITIGLDHDTHDALVRVWTSRQNARHPSRSKHAIVSEAIHLLASKEESDCHFYPDPSCISDGGHVARCDCPDHIKIICGNDPGCRGYKR